MKMLWFFLLLIIVLVLVSLYRVTHFEEYSGHSFQNIMKANDHLGSKMTEKTPL